jgi:hypothetical protein
MGCMSASDAAPLPRLGEVFFDVRGESRSMRLSWYADTGVAVFSIWQGGTCTGTFRLPITDLPRMVEALQRGPHGHDDPPTGEQAASRESRRPPARSPRPEPADGDIMTGQTTAAIYLPPVEAELAGYQPAAGSGGDFTGDYPPADFSSEYPLGYSEDLTGHPTGPAGDFTGGYGAGQAEHTGDYTSDYAAGQAEHTGDYATGPAGHTGDYATGPAGHTGDFSRDYAAGQAEHAGDFTGEYAAGPAADAPGKRRSRHRGRPEEDAGGYQAPPPPAKRGSRHRGRPEEDAGGYQAPPPPGYPTGEAPSYRAEPDTPSYPGEPVDDYLAEEDDPRTGRGRRGRRGSRGYPDEEDYGSYPDEPATTGYGSPGPPYVSGDPPEQRKPRGRRRAEPAPESFPYGPPPTDDEPQPRERYPGRH